MGYRISIYTATCWYVNVLLFKPLARARALLSITDGFLRAVYAGRGPGGLVCSNRCIRNVSAGTHNMQAVDDTSEAVDVDGGLRATADEEKKYRP